jgi:hypothetical protein
LGGGEDDVVRFYACKSIENILAQSVSAGYKFATLDVAKLLLEIYHSVKNDAFRTSAAVALSHVVKLNKAIFPRIFDSIGAQEFSASLSDSTQRIQQAFITMLNIGLTEPY